MVGYQVAAGSIYLSSKSWSCANRILVVVVVAFALLVGRCWTLNDEIRNLRGEYSSQTLLGHLFNACCRPCSFGIESHPSTKGGALDILIAEEQRVLS